MNPDATLSITQNSTLNRHKRDAIQMALQMAGFPAVMDGTHVICSGLDTMCEWAAMSAHEELKHVLSGPYHAEAMEKFVTSVPLFAVEFSSSPGLSFRSGQASLDGVSMKLRFVERNANEGPVAYVVPVTRFHNGFEWTDQVAMVPKTHLQHFLTIMAAATESQRMVNTSGLILRCWNGADESIQPMALNDIIMDRDVKSSFVDDITGFLTRRDWYGDRRLSWTRKYLLNGPPGTGKTSLARWAASELGMPAFTVDFADGWLSSGSFKRFLGHVSRNAPSLIILDDFEKIMSGQNRSGVTSHTILTSFSGMGSMDGIVVIATSNSTGPFRGPMARRFDATIEVPLPNASHRATYLKRILERDEIDDGFLEIVARDTNGWSFDDLRAAVTSAASNMVMRGGESISSMDVSKGVNFIAKRRIEDREPNTTTRASGQTGVANGHRHSYNTDDRSTGEVNGHAHAVLPGQASTEDADGHGHSLPENLRRP